MTGTDTRHAAGGEAHRQALETEAGVGDAGAERDDDGEEPRILEEAAGDDGGERGEDDAEPTGEVGERGLDRGREGGTFHENIPSTKPGAGARRMVAGVGPMAHRGV